MDFSWKWRRIEKGTKLEEAGLVKGAYLLEQVKKFAVATLNGVFFVARLHSEVVHLRI